MGQEPRDWTYGESGEIHGVSLRDQGESATRVQSEKAHFADYVRNGVCGEGANQGKTQWSRFFDAIGPSKTPPWKLAATKGPKAQGPGSRVAGARITASATWRT